MTDTQTKPVTIEEIADRLIPATPQISPDGRHIAFTVATSGRKENRHDRAIWVSTDGQPARHFTGGSGNNQGPRWSPDSSQILFHAQREEDDHHRLYLIPVHGGEAQQLGELKGAMSAPRWSPDGSMVSVLLSDTESEDEKKRKEEKDDAVVFEEQDKVDRLWVVEVASGKAQCLTHGKRHVRDYAWSPDGEHLVLVTSDSPTANEMFRSSSLRVIPSSGGTSRHLADFRNLPGDPVVRTVDGEQVVAFVGNDHREDPSYAVWTIPLRGGTKRKLIENERAATAFLIADPASPDGLIVAQADGARARHYRLSMSSGKLTPIPMQSLDDRGSITSAPSIARGTGDLAVVWTTIDVPEEVYRVSSDGRASRLTSFGDAFEGRLSGGELVTWESTDGVDIEGVLVYPRDYEEGTRYPLLVQVHGGPAWHWQDRINMSWHDWAQMSAAKGFAVLLPNPRGSIGYGSPFEQLLQDDVGGGESQDLVSGALAMVERGIASRDRLAIGGWSWGGYLTAWTITQTDIFRAAVMGAGVANLVSDHGAGDIAEYNTLLYPDHPYRCWDPYANRSPVRFACNVTAPTLIVHGEEDKRVHISQGQEYYRALQVCGVPVQFVRYPREEHSFQEYRHQIDLMQRVEAWLTKHLDG
jgi:dipeptidyl aminopeptidase/acylaminoacyl peptidase